MPFTDHKGVRLSWDEMGQGSPILLIMGHRYSSALWYPARDALAAEHRVIWFDNRGTGDSATTRKVTVADLAGDALAVIDAAGVDRAHVYGVSMGGVIALEVALQQPRRVRSLVLGCTGVLTADKPRMPAAMRLLYHLPPKVLAMLLPGRRGDRGYGSAAPPEAITADLAMLAKDRSTVTGLKAQAAAIAGYVTTAEAVAALPQPALVLHGDEDATVPFAYGEELAQTLSHGRFVTLPGAGHNFFIAAGEAANAAVLGFLREVDGG